jgi:chemotaxis protein histidine kinase CheA
MDFELEELKREFLTEADEKVRELQTLAAAPVTGDVVSRITYLSHQLKGAGGSYGFQEISTEAAAIEALLEKYSGTTLDAGILSHIDNLATRVAQNLAELSTSSAT